MKRKSRNMMKSVISLVLTVALVLGVVPLPFLPVIREVHAEGSVSYLDAAGEMQTVDDPIALTSPENGGDLILNYEEPKWFVVNGEVTINGELCIYSDVNLILADDSELKVNGGYNCIYMHDNNASLTIYSQSTGNSQGKMTLTVDGTGILVRNSLTINGGQISVAAETAGVYVQGNMTVNGGHIDVRADQSGVMINSGSLTVNNGNVTITSTSYECVRFSDSDSSMTVNNGVVTVTSETKEAIEDLSKVQINGGTVTGNNDIIQGTPMVTAPTANTLVYTGEAQELVTAGTTTLGTLKYSTDGTNYSADIPTGIAAGNYTVYYKVDGGDTWNAVEPQSVSVTIQETAANIHVHNFSYTADGAEITAVCSAGNCPLENNKAMLTLVRPLHEVYGDGKSAAATISGDTDAFEELSITYKKGNDVLEQAPVDAGSYTANITIGGKTATVSYTIAKASQQAPEAPAAESVTTDSITLTAHTGYEYKCGNGD